MELKRSRFDYKWVILVICFLMEFLCLGFCSSNAGLYTKAVTEALEIKRSIYSLSTSIRYAVQVFAAMYFGYFVHRFGIKKMAVFGLATMTLSVLVRGVATEFYHLYIGGALWGLGTVFAGGTMASSIVRRWFHKDVGRYTGIVMSSNGIGGAIAAQIVTPIINNGEVFGYRKAYYLCAAISLVITVLVVLFLREHPADGPAIQTTGGKKTPKGSTWVGIPYEVAKRKFYFYAAAGIVLLSGISIQSLSSISLVYYADIGLSSGFIAALATIGSLFLTVAKVLVGVTYDKKGLRFALLLCQFSAAAGFVLKALASNTTQGMVFVLIATVLCTFASTVETVMIPLLCNDLFGAVSYEKFLGIFMAMKALGLCLGAPLGDLYFDMFGTYRPCFWFFAIIMAAVGIGYIPVIRAVYKEKAAIIAAQNISQ